MKLVKIFIDYDTMMANMNNIEYDDQYSRRIKNILMGAIKNPVSIEIICNEPKWKKYFLKDECKNIFGIYLDKVHTTSLWFKKYLDNQEELVWKTNIIMDYKKNNSSIMKTTPETILYCDDDDKVLDTIRKNVSNLSTCNMKSLVSYINNMR